MNHKKAFFHLSVLLIITVFVSSCGQKKRKSYDFNDINDRVGSGEEFWSIPLEDWQIKDGRIECMGSRANMRVNLLTADVSGEGKFSFPVQMGILKKGNEQGSAGIRITLKDETDNNYRSLCYFGDGIDVGMKRTEGMRLYVFPPIWLY